MHDKILGGAALVVMFCDRARGAQGKDEPLFVFHGPGQEPQESGEQSRDTDDDPERVHGADQNTPE